MRHLAFVACSFFLLGAAFSESVADETARLPVVFSDDFEAGMDRWQSLDPKSWKIARENGNHVLSQFVKQASYSPPHRSPFHIALVKDVAVSDFELTTRVKSTHPEYGHRDVVLAFGYQDPARFYYVHLASQADDHANQIFVVDNAPRLKISATTTEGTRWSDDWHTVRIRRTVEDGRIEVYFDDMQKPAMTAVDRRFTWGQVGVGTFDDTSDWDDFELRGQVVSPGEKP